MIDRIILVEELLGNEVIFTDKIVVQYKANESVMDIFRKIKRNYLPNKNATDKVRFIDEKTFSSCILTKVAMN